MNDIKPINPLYDPKTDNQAIDPQVQSMINQPLKDDSGFSEEDQALLDLIIKKIEDGSIQIYSPSSLLNQEVYETLNPADKGKADQNAMVLITKIREITELMKAFSGPTYQVKNLVESLNEAKKRMEGYANIFII